MVYFLNKLNTFFFPECAFYFVRELKVNHNQNTFTSLDF